MKIQIAGAAVTKFGEHWDKSLIDLAQEASFEALQDAGLDKNQVEAVFVGNMLSGQLQRQEHLGAVVASALGICTGGMKIEGACASGGLAVHTAIQSLMSGMYETVLIVGVEKMTDFAPGFISSALMGAGSEEERLAGLTFPSLYALIAKAHMQEFGTTREHMAQVAVKNHYHASLNEKAQFPFKVSLEKVLNSSKVTDPFTLLDSSPITDGAAALVLRRIKNPSSLAGRQESRIKNVYITASTMATDTISLSERKNLTELRATKDAAVKAFDQAGVSQADIDVMEVHDCFTIAEILAMEDLGFCQKGEGGKFIASGDTKLGGKKPVNTSGGLKGCGHPVGATGVKQIVEIRDQLIGRAGKRQVNNAKVGLTQNVGGTGATVVIHVLQI